MKMPNDMHKRVIALICAFDSMMPVSKASSRPAGTRFHSRLRTDDEGSNLVEFALLLPLLLMFLTGIFSIGAAFVHHQALWQAVSKAAEVLSESRDTSSDPCAEVFAAIQDAAPNLTPTSINISLTMNGAGASGTSCAGSVSALKLQTGQKGSVTVQATYPCSVQVFGITVAPITCTATSTQREF